MMVDEMEQQERKMCMTDDSRELDEMAASPAVTCGMCGLKAHDASYVCEAGIHSDLT